MEHIHVRTASLLLSPDPTYPSLRRRKVVVSSGQHCIDSLHHLRRTESDCLPHCVSSHSPLGLSPSSAAWAGLASSSSCWGQNGNLSNVYMYLSVHNMTSVRVCILLVRIRNNHSLSETVSTCSIRCSGIVETTCCIDLKKIFWDRNIENYVCFIRKSSSYITETVI